MLFSPASIEPLERFVISGFDVFVSTLMPRAPALLLSVEVSPSVLGLCCAAEEQGRARS